jgi:hypothetical protein
VGWRERDWAKFDDGEVRSLLGPAHAPRRQVRAVTLLAVAISAVGIVFVTHLHELGGPGHAAARVLTPEPRVVGPPTDLIRIRWSSSDTVPAAHSGRICVTDPQHGRMCASYVVGERPADTLTRRIESLGLRVESSG